MAELGICIAGKLIEVLGSKAIEEVFQMWNYKSQLEDLKKTVNTIQKVLLDADAKWELSHEEQDYINNLKYVVYDADDLFDEIRTLAELNQLKSLNKVDKIIAKVRSIFSSKNPVVQAYKRSHEVKNIKSRLVSIADNHTKFGFSVDYKPIVKRREETCSYVNVKDIIGRDEDKEAIIDMLLDRSVNEDVCFLSIVGVGGLGKTALVQYVFNDEKIQNEFPSFRLWVCVSDQNGVKLDVKIILCQMLELVNKKLDICSSKEVVQKKFQETFGGKKYLLVLDDLWNEDYEVLRNFRSFLEVGAWGNRIVITTRSEKTTSNIRSEHVYKLKTLSQEDSRCLFETSAFGENEKNNELVEIGEKIVEKCHRTPLAIKVVGSLLYGQDINKWKSIKNSELGEICEGSEKILPILELSYHNLTPSLKSCFTYCAIFPKGFRMKKEMLMSLWMVQGYIVLLDGGQSVEDAAEEYFLILMRRCFFQGVENDDYGNVRSVQIHDLMHDVAQEMGKEEISVVTSRESNFGENVRHVRITRNGIANIFLSSSKIRSYICRNEHLWNKQAENLMTVLRVLDLSYLYITSLPHSIDKLLLLRYLDLRGNTSLEVLPNAITRLYNLQTLLLRYCTNLREIPEDFTNLINLRHLDFHGCDKLSLMPSMGKFTNLRVLPYFVANNEISDNELKVLQQVFNKIKGRLCIEFVYEVNDTVRGNSKSMNILATLNINNFGDKWVILEGLLKKLKLPPYLNTLDLSKYNGTTIPWSILSFPHYLRDIKIMYCKNLEQIPVLSKLPHLKSLQLSYLDSMEYMENNGMSSNSNNDTKAIHEFFPSLEFLAITSLPKLKRWWKGDFLNTRLRFSSLSHLNITSCHNFTSFAPCSNPEYLPQLELPNLCTLEIYNCLNLASNLICPSTLENLKLVKTSKRLLLLGEFMKLREMTIHKVDHLKLLPPTNFLTSLEIMGNIEVESALEFVQSCASSLRILKFRNCKNLRGLAWLHHFTALEELYFFNNDKWSICEEEEEEPWKSLAQSLRRLHFSDLPKMKSLPKGLQQLTSLEVLYLFGCKNMKEGLSEWMNSLSSLQYLDIESCPGIKSLPEAIKDLTSLKELKIRRCPNLEERCKKPNGEDYSKIQHIPKIKLGRKWIQ